MRHFVAYHNAERMGASLQDGDPFCVLTNKPVQRLVQNTVWFVESEGSRPKRYLLSSVFVVQESGERGGDFKFYARGRGHVFEPRILLNELPWFAEFFRTCGHFSLGVREIPETKFIEELTRLASAAGYLVG